MKLYTSHVVGALALMFSISAQSTVLAPGGIVNLNGTTTAVEPDLAGSVKNDNLIPFTHFFNALQTAGGNVQNRVVESDNLATLIFSPRIRDTFNIAVREFHILSFSVTGYAGWDTDVEYRTDGLGDKGPTVASRSVDGNTLTFRFGDPLIVDGFNPPGRQQESLFPSILTNATDFALVGSMTIVAIDAANPGIPIDITIDGIAAPVPLPASLPLFAAAAALLGFIRNKRHR